jgi:hypothetical protein
MIRFLPLCVLTAFRNAAVIEYLRPFDVRCVLAADRARTDAEVSARLWLL